MGGAMISKSLIKIFVDGWGYVPSLFFGLRPNYGRGKGGNGDLLQRTYASPVIFSAPDHTAEHCQLMLPPEIPGHSQTSLAQSLVGSLLLSPGSWCTQCPGVHNVLGHSKSPFPSSVEIL